jgi:hypothetical protein
MQWQWALSAGLSPKSLVHNQIVVFGYSKTESGAAFGLAH